MHQELASEQSNILIAAPTTLGESGLSELSENSKWRIISVNSLDELHRQIKSNKIDLILVENDLPGLDFVGFIGKIRLEDHDLPILVIGGNKKPIEDVIWNAGIDDALIMPVVKSELTHRINRSLRLLKLTRLNDRLSRENAGLYKLSTTDGLTKLYNRRYFDEILNLEFTRARRFGKSLSCIILDIDHFKRVNDVYGHLYGDYVLSELAVILKKKIREIDTLARYGGEEFVLLLPETGDDGAKYVAERLRQSVEEFDFRKMENEKRIGSEKLTISLGVSFYPQASIKTGADLVNRADQGLYFAKENGRNQVGVINENDIKE